MRLFNWKNIYFRLIKMIKKQKPRHQLIKTRTQSKISLRKKNQITAIILKMIKKNQKSAIIGYIF